MEQVKICIYYFLYGRLETLAHPKQKTEITDEKAYPLGTSDVLWKTDGSATKNPFGVVLGVSAQSALSTIRKRITALGYAQMLQTCPGLY